MKKTTRYILVGGFVAFIVTVVFCFAWYNEDKFVIKTSEPALQTSLIAERIASGSSKENISYCNNEKLDFFAPTLSTEQKAPLVIYVHGGGWHKNNKDSDSEIRSLFEGLRSKGYALASIDYSLTPEYQYPKPQQDVLCAVRFMRANAMRFSIDGDKVVLAGFSAGANLAALAGTNSDLSAFNNGLYRLTHSDVQAVIGIGGVYDFNRNLHPNSIGNIKNLMQNNNPSQGSPSTYVHATSAPMLLIHGANDSVVYPLQSVDYGNLLTTNKVVNSVIIVKNAEHDLSNSGGAASPSKSELSATIEVFLRQQLGL